MKVKISKYPSPKGEITVYRLTNDRGCYVELSTLGAGILAVAVPDRDGKIENVALSYADPADYLYDGPCMGKAPGRFANRIAAGRFSIDGKEYQLNINNGPNALHGGPEGFQNQIWQSKPIPGGVEFSYDSADGEENYPGNLKVKAIYHWGDNNILQLHLTAQTDAPTPVNLTNHTYWNLGGADSGSVLGHTLRMKASRYLPTDDTLIPTGEIAPVAGTPMDFTEAKEIGRDIDVDFPALKYGKGYDACWAIDSWKKGDYTAAAARLVDPLSGRVLEIGTTQPGMQVYTGNWLAGSPANRSGRPYNDYEGVAIECQGFPDAPNKENFPGAILRPAERYDEHIRFAFSTL